jgi:hypothetical protein
MIDGRVLFCSVLFCSRRWNETGIPGMGLDGCVSESWKLRGATHSALTGPYGHARVIFGDHGASDLDYIQAPAFAILRSPTRRYAAPRPSSCRRSDAKNLDRCSFP